MSYEGARTEPLQLKGVNEDWSATPPAALSIVDMRWDPEGYWHTMPGFVRVDDAVSGVDGEVLWLQWFSPKGTRERYLMVEVAVTTTTSKLGYINLATGAFVAVQASRRRTFHPWPGIQTLEHNGWLYLMDGANPAVRWAPDQPVTPVGFHSGPGTMNVVAGDADGGVDIYDYSGVVSTQLVGAGPETVAANYAQQRGLGVRESGERFEYAYAFTVLSDIGMESPASPLAYCSGATAVDADGADGLGARRGSYYTIPRQPAQVRGVRVWRTKNQYESVPLGRPPLYLLTTAFHGCGFEALDFAQDEELGEQLDESQLGPTPVGLKAACIFNETLFGIAQDSTTVVFSYPGLIEQFPWQNQLPLSTPASGPLTSIHAAPRGVIVFAERAVFIIKSTADLRFYGQPLIHGVGSLSGRGVVEIPRVGFAFIDVNAGPMAIIGSLDDDTETRVIPIAEEIRRKWKRRVNREALSQVRATLDPASREVWWQVPEGGGQLQTLGIVYHYGADGWSFRESWPIGDLDYDRGYVWFGGQASKIGVYVVTPNATDKGGTAFSSTYETQWFRFLRRNMLPRTHWWVIGTGDGQLRLSTRIERRQDWVDQYEGTIPTAMPTECELAQWGTATWSTTETFSEYMPTVIPISIDARVALEHQLRLTSPATTSLRVIALQVEAPQGSPLDPDMLEG